jgi:hypothetical protein
MKKIAVILVFTAMAACGPDLRPQLEKLETENKFLREMAGPLPASLDNFYPPLTQAPVYLLDMFAIATPLEGIGADLYENDMAGARENFEAFKSAYQKTAGMVDEWKEKFPMAPLDTLDQALKIGDIARIGPAMAKIGDVCSACHLMNQTKAYQKYHWPDFGMLSLTDPVSGGDLSWHEFMMGMSGNYSAISTSLQQDQLENARGNFQAFSLRFKSMAEGCFGCHETPRTSFTDASVQDMIKELGIALDHSVPDADRIEKLNMAIGNEGCLKCHYVHMPAVFARQQWKHFEEVVNQP